MSGNYDRGKIFVDSVLKNTYTDLVKNKKLTGVRESDVIEEVPGKEITIRNGGIEEKIIISNLQLNTSCTMEEIKVRLKKLEEDKIVFVNDQMEITTRTLVFDLQMALKPIFKILLGIIPADLILALEEVVDSIVIGCRISSNDNKRHLVKVIVEKGNEIIVCILKFEIVSSGYSWFKIFTSEKCKVLILSANLTLLKLDF